MRVIGGKNRGIALRGGKGPQFRPTAQIVKGSVFDTLYSDVQNAVVLDLFAGSGSMGIEALSRGASRAVFVEQDPSILKALRTNIERCRFSKEQALVHRGDATRFLENAIKADGRYDLILADPPYASSLGGKLATMLGKARENVCKMFIIETGNEIQGDVFGRMEKLRTRKFGQTVVTYFRYKQEEKS